MLLLAPAALLLALPEAASAHGLVQRSSLPIPDWLFWFAAATVLVVSFLALSVLWPRPKLEDAPWRPLPGGRLVGSRAVEIVCGAIGVALLVVVVVAGYVGDQSPLNNLAPPFILITFWVGMVFASILFGDLFRAFSPWRALGRVLRLRGIRPYPERLGRWPAAIALLAFTWIELVSGWSEEPATLVTAVVGYTRSDARGPVRLGDRDVVAARRGVLGLLRAVRAHLGVRDARARARPAAAARRAAQARPRARPRSRSCR